MQKSKINQPAKADDSVEEYTEKELQYIDKYHAVTENNFDDDEIYDLITKFNYDDVKIRRELNEMMKDIKKGEDYKWHEQGKKKKDTDKAKKEADIGGFQKNPKYNYNKSYTQNQDYRKNNYYYGEDGNEEKESYSQSNQNYRGKTRGSRGGINTRGRGGKPHRGRDERGGKAYYDRQEYLTQNKNIEENEVVIEKEITDTPQTVVDKRIEIEPKVLEKPIEVIKQEKKQETPIETPKIQEESKCEILREEHNTVITPQKPQIIKETKETFLSAEKKAKEDKMSEYKKMEEQILKESIFNPVRATKEIEFVNEITIRPNKPKVFERYKTEEFTIKADFLKQANPQPVPSSSSQKPKKQNEYQQQQQEMKYYTVPGNPQQPENMNYPPYYIMMPAMMPYEQHDDNTKGQKPYPYPYPYPYPVAHPNYPQEKDQIRAQPYDYIYNNPYAMPMPMPMPMGGMDPSLYGQKMQQQPDPYGYKK